MYGSNSELILGFSLHCHALRYAFTPLIDDSDDEDIEEFLVSANLGMMS